MDAYPNTSPVTLSGQPPYHIDIDWSTEPGPVSVPFRLPGQDGVFQYFNQSLTNSGLRTAAIHPDTLYQGSWKWLYANASIDPNNGFPPSQQFAQPDTPWAIPLGFPNDIMHATSTQSGETLVYDNEIGYHWGELPFRQSIVHILDYDVLRIEYIQPHIPYVEEIKFPTPPAWGGPWGYFTVDTRTSPYDSSWPLYVVNGEPSPYHCYSWIEYVQSIRLYQHPVVTRSVSILPNLAALALFGMMGIMRNPVMKHPIR